MKLRSHWNLMLLSLVLALSLSCSPAVVAQPKFKIPTTPVLPDPIAKVQLDAKVIGNDAGEATGVCLDLSDVDKLGNYIANLRQRSDIIQALLLAHIEKLTNRLKSLGGE